MSPSRRSSAPGSMPRNSSTTSGSAPRQVADEVRARLAAAAERPRRRHRARPEHARTDRAAAVGGSVPTRRRRVAAAVSSPPTASSTRFAGSSIGSPKRASTSSRSRRAPSRRSPNGSRDAVDDRVACVLVSSVLFETAEIVPDLGHVAAACDRVGAVLLVDAYHHLNVVPFDIDAPGSVARLHRRRRLQVLPARRGQLLPAGARRLRSAPGHHRLVQRVRRAGGGEARRRRAVRARRGAVRRRDLRSDVALSRRRGVSLSRQRWG